jgi:hypothetical protein
MDRPFRSALLAMSLVIWSPDSDALPQSNVTLESVRFIDEGAVVHEFTSAPWPGARAGSIFGEFEFQSDLFDPGTEQYHCDDLDIY